ncbi:MAG: AAA family ATPase [Oscillospiraceae bacterium]|nr:AAA family ATPase [Oscillospiraceae bacterium]
MTDAQYHNLYQAVDYRLIDYLTLSNILIDKAANPHWTTACPHCSQPAHIMMLPSATKPVAHWSCPACGHEGNAVAYVRELWGYAEDKHAVFALCRTLRVPVPYLDTITAEELLSREYTPKPELIEGALTAGVYLLVGAPKLGKSWLSICLSHCVSTGSPLWGRAVTKGSVLYLALEDDDERLQARLHRVCDSSTGHITFATHAGILGTDLELQIHNHLRENNDTKLIIIDTLAKVRDIQNSNSAYLQDYDAISRIKHIADKHGITIIIVHHTRKQESDDVMMSISGTNGLLGAADGAMILTRPRRMEAEAVLSITGRDVPDTELYLTQDKDTMRWELAPHQPDNSNIPKDDPVIVEVADYIAANGAWTGTAQQLSDILSAQNPSVRVNPNVLSRKINDYAVALRHRHGVDVSRGKDGNVKLIILRPVDGLEDL